MNKVNIKNEDEYNFTQVRNEIIETDTLDIYEKMVYIVIRKHSFYGKNEVFTKLETIAKQAGCSVRKVSAVVNSLKEKGLINIEHRPNTSSIYTVLRIPDYLKKEKDAQGASLAQHSSQIEQHASRHAQGASEEELLNNKITNNNNTISAVEQTLKNTPNIPTYRILSPKRKSAIKARLSEYKLEEVLSAIESIALSDFFRDSYNSKANWYTIDWIFNPNNFLKIVEGKYVNKKRTQQQVVSQPPQKKFDPSQLFAD